MKSRAIDRKSKLESSITGEGAGKRKSIGDNGFAEMDDTDFSELMRLIGMYRKQAAKCQSAKAYLAGCVMLGSAMEGALIAAVVMFPDEAKLSARIPRRTNGEIKHVLDWNLSQLLIVGEDIRWFPRGLSLENVFEEKNAKPGDYAERVRIIRNLAHPGRYMKEHFARRVTKSYLEHLFEIVDGITHIILNRVYDDLRKHVGSESLK